MFQKLSIVVPILLAGCTHVVGTSPTITGSGKKASATRALEPFDSVRGSGAFRLEVRADGTSPGVTIEGDDNIVPLFESVVSGGTLELHLPSGSYNLKEPLIVRVDAPELERVETSGAIDTDITGVWKDSLGVMCSGASKLRAQGKTNVAKFQASGAIEFEAFDLVAQRVEVSASGSSRARVHAASRLQVDASGACTVTYRGRPQVESSTSGSSSVRAE